MRFEVKNHASHLTARRHRGTGAASAGVPVHKRVGPHHAARTSSHFHGRDSARHQEELNKGAEALRRSLAAPQRSYSRSEIATAATMLEKLRRGEDLRYEKVEQVREAVVADRYDDNPTLDIVVDRLLEDLFD